MGSVYNFVFLAELQEVKKVLEISTFSAGAIWVWLEFFKLWAFKNLIFRCLLSIVIRRVFFDFLFFFNHIFFDLGLLVWQEKKNLSVCPFLFPIDIDIWLSFL